VSLLFRKVTTKPNTTMPLWSAMLQAFLGRPNIARCDEAAPAAPTKPAATEASTPQPIVPKPAKRKQYKPLPASGTFDSCDAMSMQILNVLQQQNQGCQVVVSKQLTPFLAVVHDFNIGIEQYIPKQMGASIYTFRAMMTDMSKTNTMMAQVDWFGRLNGSLQHKWNKSLTTSVSTHISNSHAVSTPVGSCAFVVAIGLMNHSNSRRVRLPTSPPRRIIAAQTVLLTQGLTSLRPLVERS